MSCSCNGYCNNQDCSGHITTCANSYSFTAVAIGTIIDDVHMDDLYTAVNGAYTRRGLALPSWPTFPVSGGDIVTAARYNTTKTNINALHAGLVTSVFSVAAIVYAAETIELQTDANTVRNECICNYNCTCNINCSCNVNCSCNYP